jgi:hypothetical protein
MLTVIASVPDFAWVVAVIVVCPAATAVARPAADTVITDWLEDCHVAVLVTFCVVESDMVAVAVNWLVCPTALNDAVPVTAIDATVAGDGAVGAGVDDEPPHPAAAKTSPTASH